MPTFTELVAEIQSSDWDKGKEVAKQLAEIYQKLEKDKQSEIAQLQKDAKTILALVSAEGDDFASKLKDASKKIAAKEETIKKLNQDLEARTSEVTELKQNQLLNQVEKQSGVNIRVFKTLLSEEDKVEIAAEKVTVNGKEIKDWAKESKPDFLASLFPTQNEAKENDLPPGGSEGGLPTGGTEGSSDNQQSQPPSYIDKKYSPKHVQDLIANY